MQATVLPAPLVILIMRMFLSVAAAPHHPSGGMTVAAHVIARIALIAQIALGAPRCQFLQWTSTIGDGAGTTTNGIATMKLRRSTSHGKGSVTALLKT